MRIDNYLFSEGKFESRNKAKEAVERGEVTVNGKPVKPSYVIREGDDVKLQTNAGKYVSNGAFKLERAFEAFDLSAEGKIFADIGASTGGFTQCLLMHGAAKVYAVDVGESLLHPSLKNDSRVTCIENFNARFLSSDVLGGEVDAIVSDVSFISLTYILGGISRCIKEGGYAVVLIKPQFECGRENLSKNGVVTSLKARSKACLEVVKFAYSVGLSAAGFCAAPIREGKNIEYLLHLKKGGTSVLDEKYIDSVCRASV